MSQPVDKVGLIYIHGITLPDIRKILNAYGINRFVDHLVFHSMRGDPPSRLQINELFSKNPNERIEFIVTSPNVSEIDKKTE
jgi:hypothetical protein